MSKGKWKIKKKSIQYVTNFDKKGGTLFLRIPANIKNHEDYPFKDTKALLMTIYEDKLIVSKWR